MSDELNKKLIVFGLLLAALAAAGYAASGPIIYAESPTQASQPLDELNGYLIGERQKRLGRFDYAYIGNDFRNKVWINEDDISYAIIWKEYYFVNSRGMGDCETMVQQRREEFELKYGPMARFESPEIKGYVIDHGNQRLTIYCDYVQTAGRIILWDHDLAPKKQHAFCDDPHRLQRLMAWLSHE